MSDQSLGNSRLNSLRVLDVLDGRVGAVSTEAAARALRDEHLSRLLRAAGKSLRRAGSQYVRSLSRLSTVPHPF